MLELYEYAEVVMRLTQRDKDIIKYLKRAKCLTTEQIAKVFFPGRSLDAVRKRMRKLVSRSYLSLNTSLGISLFHLDSLKISRNCEHTMAINDVRITAGAVDFFYAHWELGEFNWEYPVIPDAVFKKDGKVYLLEVDMGTESKRQLKDKFSRYMFDFEYTLIIIGNKSIKKLAEDILGQNVIAATLSELKSTREQETDRTQTPQS